MICPNCGHEQPDGAAECRRCGLIFAKYRKAAAGKPEAPVGSPEGLGEADVQPIEDEEVQGLGGWLLDRVLYVDAPVNPFYFGGRALTYAVLLVWGMVFIIKPLDDQYAGNSVLHLVNLPFHEAGHVFFQLFGEFLMMAGGSLGQIIMPLICLGAFLWHKNPFGASVCLWWTGESLMDLAPYIGDARALKLVLVGGFTGQDAAGMHDWRFLLSRLGWMEYDRVLAHVADKAGILIMVAAFLWGGWLLLQQYRHLDRGPG